MGDNETDFIPVICELKHENIDREVDDIKTNVKDIDTDIKDIDNDLNEMRENQYLQHEEIKKMIENLSKDIKNSHINLKNKIVLSEKTMGDKIDSLNDFDETLKGNGDPGIWEIIRNTRRDVKIIIVLLVIFIGGRIFGVSLKNIKNNFFGKTEIKQVEPSPVEMPKIP